MCKECRCKTKTCSTCNKENAFEELKIDMETMRRVDDFFENNVNSNQSEAIEEFQSMITGSCYRCKKDNKLLFMCLECFEEAGFMKMSKAGSIVFRSPDVIPAVKRKLFCERCKENHENDHNVYSVMFIANFRDVVTLNYVMEHQKKDAEDYGKHAGYINIWKGKIHSHLEMIKKNQLLFSESNGRKKCEFVEVEEASKKSLMITKEFYDELRKLKTRLLMFEKEHVSMFFNTLKVELDDENQNRVNRNTLQKLMTLSESVNPEELNSLEIQEIDNEID